MSIRQLKGESAYQLILIYIIYRFTGLKCSLPTRWAEKKSVCSVNQEKLLKGYVTMHYDKSFTTRLSRFGRPAAVGYHRIAFISYMDMLQYWSM